MRSSGRIVVRWTSQVTTIQTPTTSITISAGTTNSWMMKRADGGSTGGSMSSPLVAPELARRGRIRFVGAELGRFVGSREVGHGRINRVE